jgi:hypothetical protein
LKDKLAIPAIDLPALDIIFFHFGVFASLTQETLQLTFTENYPHKAPELKLKKLQSDLQLIQSSTLNCWS